MSYLSSMTPDSHTRTHTHSHARAHPRITAVGEVAEHRGLNRLFCDKCLEYSKHNTS